MPPPSSQKRYAIIINGDTEERHQKNVDRAIETLRAEGVHEIHVASVASPSAKADRYVGADQESLEGLIAGLKEKVDDDDLLVVYVTGHGGKGEQGECVQLQGTCLTLGELSERLNTIRYGRRIVVADECKGGGLLPLFADSKTHVVTQAAPDEDCSCETFSPFFWSREATDADGNGAVTIDERYRFALEKGPVASLTSYFSPSTEISFSGAEDAQSPFGDQVVEVHDGASLRQLLGTLQPGQLALVTFSADWCAPCKHYAPHFDDLAKRYGGKFLMIRAEGIDGSEEDWEEFYPNIPGFPSVAFIDHRGHLTPVDKMDPIDSLLFASVYDRDEQVQIRRNQLKSADPVVRARALAGLLGMGENAAPLIPDLIVLCGDSNDSIRNLAITLLGILPVRQWSNPPVDELIALLDYPNPLVQMASCWAITSLGKKAARAKPKLEELLASLSAEDLSQRLNASGLTVKAGSAFSIEEMYRNAIEGAIRGIEGGGIREFSLGLKFKPLVGDQFGTSTALTLGGRRGIWRIGGNLFLERYENQAAGKEDKYYGFSLENNFHLFGRPNLVDPYVTIPEIGFRQMAGGDSREYFITPIGAGIQILLGDHAALFAGVNYRINLGDDKEHVIEIPIGVTARF